MRALMAVFLGLISGFTMAAQPYAVQNIMLLQPDFVLQERVNVDELSSYIKSLESAASKALIAVGKPSPTSGFIILAVRPGGLSKVWLDFSPALPVSVNDQFRASLQKVRPFQARNGVVVFAVNVSLWGAAPSNKQGPDPVEWRNVVKGLKTPIEIGDLVDRAWPVSVH